MKIPLILASSSPRRLALLTEAGYEPRVIVPAASETLPAPMSVSDAVMFLALKKALAVRQKIRGKILEVEGPLIVAADTVVYKDKILGKPKGRADAMKMLLSLSGTSHDVYTGVSVIDIQSEEKCCFYERSRVSFRSYTALDLLEYLATSEPFDKAGAYAVQGWFRKYVDHIEGSYDNVVGLPMERLQAYLAGRRM